MKRKKTNRLITAWKDTFSKGKESAVEVENLAKQAGVKSNVPTLALIREKPITFQLSRLENPKDFELMSFVIRACSKTGDKPFKTVLHVEPSRRGSRLVASDGLRLHVAEISRKIKSGDYKPHITKEVIILGDPVQGIKFPSWSKAIPENIEKRGVINLEKSGFGRNQKETENLSIAFKKLAKQTGETVNLRYIGDLTKQEWTVYSPKDGKRAIVLRQKTGKAGEPDKKSPVAVIIPIAQAA